MHKKVKAKIITTLIAFLGTTILSYGNAEASLKEDYQDLRIPLAQPSNQAFQRDFEEDLSYYHKTKKERVIIAKEDKIDQAMEIFPLLIPIIAAILGDSNSEEKDKNTQLISEIEDTKKKIEDLSREMGVDSQKSLTSLKISDRLKTSTWEDIGNFLLDLEPTVNLFKSTYALPKELDELKRQYSENTKTLEECKEFLKKLNIQQILQLQTQLDEDLKKINQLKPQVPDLKEDKKELSLNIEKEEQKQLIGANVSADGSNVKVAIVDSYFDPNQYTHGVLSPNTLQNYEGKDKAMLAEKASQFGLNHANYTANIFHSIAPAAELRMIDLRNELSLQGKEIGNERVIAAIDEAIRSKVDFINISLRISPDSDKERNSPISEEMKKAFLRAKDAGIGIIKSIGNDNEFIGQTAYTRSLAQLVEEMDGNMILVAATQYDDDWQLEKIARYTSHSSIGGSNHAGIASEYTIAAPGKNIYISIKEEEIASGTSMATPLVTAAAVLVKNIHPALSAREVFGHLLKSARKYSYDSAGEFFFPLPAGRYGQGIVNVENALELVKAQKN